MAIRSFEEALKAAKEWSLDPDNNSGQAVVTQSLGEKKKGIFTIATDASNCSSWVKARFENGERVYFNLLF